MESIISYYESYNEDGRLIKDKAHTIEFVTTVHFLDKYIDKGSKVLDLGAGTGRYSFHYAEKGACVTAVDLSPRHVAIMKEKALKDNANMSISQGNALNLDNIQDETYDVVLCLGPLYHLMNFEERAECIKECRRVLKPGGILAGAYISRFATFVNMIHRNVSNIKDPGLRNISKTGVEFGDSRDCFHYSTCKEIETLMENAQISKLEHVGTDGVGGTLRDIINKFNDEEFHNWMEYHFETCKDENLIGYSQHGLYIGMKKS